MIAACNVNIAAWEPLCKAYDYSFAQRLKKAANAAATTDGATSTSMKTTYETDHPAPTAGKAAGGRCEKKEGTKYEDGQKDRELCAEKLCCGSADKYLRDGSKMTIETC